MSVVDFVAALVLFAFLGAAFAFAVDQHFIWRKKTIAETAMYNAVKDSLEKME